MKNINNDIKNLNELMSNINSYSKDEVLTIKKSITDILDKAENILMTDDEYYQYIREKSKRKGPIHSPQHILNSVSKRLEPYGAKVLGIKDVFKGKTKALFTIQDSVGNVREDITNKNLWLTIYKTKKGSKIVFKQNFITYDEYKAKSQLDDVMVTKRTSDIKTKLDEIVETDNAHKERHNISLWKKIANYITNPF